MENKKLFEKYHSQLVWEGFFKALICGLIVGFFVNFVVAFIMWFVEFHGLWISIGIGVAAVAASTPIFYFTMFRPTTKQIASRIDRLGLEERIITMHELENDDSYIAMRQREDAKAQLKKVESEEKKIKFNIFTKKFFTPSKIAAATLAVVLGVSMTTVTGLHDTGVIGSAEEIIDIIVNPPAYYDISYFGEVEAFDENGEGTGDYIDFEDVEWEIAQGGGYFVGQTTQEDILEGTTAENILAVGVGGQYGDWAFDEWSDGYADPSRDDIVEGDTEVTAKFTKLENPQEDRVGNGQGEGDGEAGDQPGDVPSEGGEGEGSGGSGGDMPPQPSDGNGSGASGSDVNGNNNIGDGETFYGDEFEAYYQAMMEYLSEHGEEIPADLREILEVYFNALK